jgi:phenylacetate-coenzyme A ligase PaaK-like adenylate-forming protein
LSARAPDEGSQSSSERENPLAELARVLVPKTLEHAVENSAFYREHLADAWREVHGPEDLPKLPVLEKAICVIEQERMRCGPPANDFGSVSSGTTRVGSRFFRVERCDEEQEALEEFYEMVGVREQRASMPLTMHILTPNHGLPANKAPANTLRIAWAYSRNVCNLVEQGLRADLQGRRISVLRVSVSILKQLTVWFRAEGIDARDFGVREIGTYAAQVTPRWRAIFEDSWNARVFDNYSLSEFKTAATECDACGWYHFTEPPLVAEYLDPRSNEPTDHAIAHLVLTGLYPYVQRTPLIRYATNDLVLRGPRCARTGADSIRFMGRRSQTLFDRDQYLLFPALVESIVDDEAEVARHVHPSERAERLPMFSIGDAKYRTRMEGERVVLTVGTAYDPALFPTSASALRQRLAARIRDAHPDLVASGRELEIELVAGLRENDFAEWFVKYAI